MAPEEKQQIMSPSSEAAWYILPPSIVVSWQELQLDSTGTARRGGEDCWGRWEGEEGTENALEAVKKEQFC